MVTSIDNQKVTQNSGWGSAIKDLLTPIFLKLDAISLTKCLSVCSYWHRTIDQEFCPQLLRRLHFFHLSEEYFKENLTIKFLKIFYLACQNETPEKIIRFQALYGKEKIKFLWGKINRIILAASSDQLDFSIPPEKSGSEAIPLIKKALLLGKWSYLNETTHLSKQDREVFHFVCQFIKASEKYRILFELFKLYVPKSDPIWNNYSRIT